MDGKWFTTDNRRLWVFRQLERLGKCSTIDVWEGYAIPTSKLTTYNGGSSVHVRRSSGGVWYRKPDAQKYTGTRFNNLMRGHDYGMDYGRQTMYTTPLQTYHKRTDYFDNTPVQSSMSERVIHRAHSYTTSGSNRNPNDYNLTYSNGVPYLCVLLSFVIVVILFSYVYYTFGRRGRGF